MMDDEDLDAYAAFPSILLRQDAARDYIALSLGMFVVTAHASGAMLVNGAELRAADGRRSLLAGIYCSRQSFAEEGDLAPAPQPGDLIGLRVREGLVAAYGVLQAGPGPAPQAAGTLSRDAVVCELRRDLGSIHRLAVALDAPLQSQLH